MIWDTHMHSHFSGDSEASPESMIQAAISKGLSGICFTDHLDIDYPYDSNLFSLDFDAYYKEVMRLKEIYHDRISIRWGVELGLQPHIVHDNQAIAISYPFDFIIGSSHLVHGMDPYYPEYFEGKSEQSAYLEYFTSILENIDCYNEYDVYGHLDYIVRYGPNKNTNYSYHAYSDIIDTILQRIIDKGKGIEINTGGFHYGLGHPNPTEDILKRYRELGGEIITIGSDAHVPENVAFAFERVRPILMAAGFEYFTVFNRRHPEFIKL